MKIPVILLLIAAAQLTFAQKSYIHCGKLIDGVSDIARSEITVIVDGNLITGIEKGYISGNKEDRVIDLSNKTVMPGLIDCHVHIETEYTKTYLLDGFRFTDADLAYRAAVNAKKLLMAGFTTVRDLGGTGVNISLRKAIEQGLVDGPRIYTAGRPISASGGHMDKTHNFRDDLFAHNPGPDEGIADGRDELIKAVRLQFKRGSDVIKIGSTGGVLDLSENGSGAQFSTEEVRAVVETARDYGMKVASHAHGTEGIKRAILAGVTSIEHATFIDDEGIALAKKNGTWLVPTLIAGRSVMDSAKVKGYFPPIIAQKALKIAPQAQASFRKAYLAGVKIAFGTDAGVYPYGKNYKEFGYMVEAGMPPMDAIKSATTSAAMLLGIADQRGSISKGKLADIIAVEGNPLEDIRAMGEVAFVMKEGRIYK